MELVFMYIHKDTHKKIQALKNFLNEALEPLKGEKTINPYLLDRAVQKVEKMRESIDVTQSVSIVVHDYPFRVIIKEADNPKQAGLISGDQDHTRSYWAATRSR